VPPEYDIIGPWSEVKLAILREYAAPYSKIVSAKGFHHLYIDGFAGPGAHVSRETGELILGSPRIALAIEPPFKEYHFIDADLTRVEQLRALAGNRPDVHVHPGDCNEVLLREVFPRAKYSDYRRALCVLDPYNIDLSWEVVATAGQMGSVEIFLNFMVMDMNRNVLFSDPEMATPSQVARMNRFWGDESWHAATYEENPQGHLFADSGMVKVEDANEKIAEAYRQRLLNVAGFKFSPAPLRFPNRQGATMYYLFFASHDSTGHKIVQQTFDKYRQREWF
jgi:three-Cys-motif partner protein